MGVLMTGHKLFDRQSEGYAMSGNVWGNTQNSSYVRARTQTECNSHTFVEGHLRDSDLAHFKDLPSQVRTEVLSLTENGSVILYEVKHYRCMGQGVRREHKVVHGYVITTGGDSGHRRLRVIKTGRSRLAWQILEAFAREVCK